MKSTVLQTGLYLRQTLYQTLSLMSSKIILTKCLLFSLHIIKSVNANAKTVNLEVQILIRQNSIHQALESLILKLTAIHRPIFIIRNMTPSLRNLRSHKVDQKIKKHNILAILSSRCIPLTIMKLSPS
jgi:hypothetical protein